MRFPPALTERRRSRGSRGTGSERTRGTGWPPGERLRGAGTLRGQTGGHIRPRVASSCWGVWMPTSKGLETSKRRGGQVRVPQATLGSSVTVDSRASWRGPLGPSR